jgi:hypothetical protein
VPLLDEPSREGARFYLRGTANASVNNVNAPEVEMAVSDALGLVYSAIDSVCGAPEFEHRHVPRRLAAAARNTRFPRIERRARFLIGGPEDLRGLAYTGVDPGKGTSANLLLR